MLSRTLLTAAGAAAALTLTTGAAASAQGPIYEADYRVDVDLTATWKYERQEERGTEWRQETFLRGKARITSTIENVLFRNGQLVTATNDGPTEQRSEGDGYVETQVWNPVRDAWDTDWKTCTGGGESSIPMSRFQAHPDGGYVLRATAGTILGYLCDEQQRDVEVWRPSATMGDGIFDVRFTLPSEALGMGKVIQRIEASPAQRNPAYCPGQDAFTTTCEFGWEGTVTFTRTSEHQFPGTPPGETPTGPPSPAGPPINAEGLRTAVEQYVNQPKPKPINAEGLTAAVERYVNGDLKLTPGCATACTGTATLAIGAARKPVAKVRFTAKAGQRTVRLRLPTKARKAVKRAKKATLRVTTKPRGGGKATTRTLRVEG